MRAIHYLIVALVVCAGIALSVILIPSEGEIALIRFKDKDFESARTAYERRVNENGLSSELVVPLTQLYLQYGDVAQAIAVMESYLKKHPEDTVAKERLGRFYQYAQRPYEYRLNLEELAIQNPSETNLRELSDLFNFQSQFDKQIATLQKLVDLYPEKHTDFLDLANLQAAEGRFGDAAATLRNFEAIHPQRITPDTVQFMMSLQLDSGQTRAAASRASSWLGQHPSADVAARLAGVLHFKGRPAEALAVLMPFEGYADKSPAVLSELIQLQIETGARDEALSRLERLYGEKRLPDQLFESYIDLLLTTEQTPTAIAVAESYDLTLLPDWLLANLAESALAGGQADFATRIVKSTGESFLEGFPVLGGQLALARGDRVAAARWIAKAEKADLGFSSQFGLAGLYVKTVRFNDAILLLNKLVTAPEAPDSAIVDLADLYLKTERAAEGFLLLERLRSRRSTIEAHLAWALLAAASGRESEAVAWLKTPTAAKLSRAQLTDVYYVAQDNHALQLALTAAEHLYSLSADIENRSRLAIALHGAGKYTEALHYLSAIMSEGASGDEESLYVASLYGARESGAQVQSELRSYWAGRLQAPALRQEQREEAVYALLELHEYEIALPHLREFAHAKSDQWLFAYVDAAQKANRQQDLTAFLTSELQRADLPLAAKESHLYLLIEHGGEEPALPFLYEFAEAFGGNWVFSYEEALAHSGRTAELLEYRIFRSGREDISREERFQIANRIVESAHLKDAEQILMNLGRSSAPGSPEVALLLSMGGAQPTDSALTWIEGRAHSSTGPDFIAWLDMLANAGAPRRVMKVVSEVEADKKDPAVWRLYAHASLQVNERYLAELAYTEILDALPRDLEALRWLGSFAFASGRRERAGTFFERYFEQNGSDFESHFYFGEILQETGHRAEAQKHYEAALRLSQLAGADQFMKSVHAHALDRMGRQSEAVAEFTSLFKQHPGDEDLRADYAGLLLRTGKLAEAGEILAVANSFDSTERTAKRLDQLRAQFELAEGKWRSAKQYDANLTDPFIREQISNARFDVEHKSFRGLKETLYQWSGHHLFPNFFRLGVNITRDHSEIGEKRDVVKRSEFYGQYDFKNGSMLRGALFSSLSGLGAGFQFGRSSGSGRIGIQMDYHKPFWEFAEGVTGGGVRDRLEVRREQRLAKGWIGRIGAAANRYGLDVDPDAARSIALDGGVMRTFGIVGFEYAFDTERRTSPLHSSLPLVSREVHALDAFTNINFGTQLHFEAFGGFALDRLGGRGPFLGGRLIYRLDGDFDVEAAFERRLNSIATGQAVNRFKIGLVRRFK